MDENNKPILVYTTCPSLAIAEDIGGTLVEEGLCACVNILPRMVSIFSWQGQRERDEEAVMIVKTQSRLADRVTERIVAVHPYDVPAVLVLPVSGGSRSFLDWIEEQTVAATIR